MLNQKTVPRPDLNPSVAGFFWKYPLSVMYRKVGTVLVRFVVGGLLVEGSLHGWIGEFLRLSRNIESQKVETRKTKYPKKQKPLNKK